jgi:hypothetical protein
MPGGIVVLSGDEVRETRDELKRLKEELEQSKIEAEDADRFGGSLDLSTAKQTPVSHTKWIFKLLKLLCCLSSFRSQPCHFNARARKKHPVLLVLYHIWTT